MKMGKILVLILVFILILPSISLVASSKVGNGNDGSRDGIIHKLLRLRFNLGFLDNLKMGRYFVLQMRPPTPIQAYPESVSLRYLNETTFQIGGKNINNTDWRSMVAIAGGWNWAWMSTRIVFYF
jgi:hypothetical protein